MLFFETEENITKQVWSQLLVKENFGAFLEENFDNSQVEIESILPFKNGKKTRFYVISRKNGKTIGGWVDDLRYRLLLEPLESSKS